MKFEEALPLLKRGKKIRCKSWSNKEFYLNDNYKCLECDCILSIDDILADDWEILEENK